MIFDMQSLFSDAQAVTSSAASSNYYDKSVAKVFFGRGVPMLILCQVVETVTAAGAATVTFAVESDDNTGFSSATVLATTAAIGKATLIAGYVVPISFIMHGIDDTERYIRLNYTVATGPLTAGKFTAGVVLGGNLQSRGFN